MAHRMYVLSMYWHIPGTWRYYYNFDWSVPSFFSTVACKYNETYVNTTRQEAVLNWAENVGEWADCFPFSLALCALVSCCISALAACVSLYVRPTVDKKMLQVKPQTIKSNLLVTT